MTKAQREYVTESSILKALPLDDDDDLQLSDCQVLDTNTNEPVSLLTAATFNPVTVVGTLNPLPKNKWHHYARPEHRNKVHHIEITNVTRNAFGEYDDGTFGLWVAGETGWYDIKGATEYKSMMEFMREDIRTFYFIADAYKEPRVVGHGRKARRLPEFTAQELIAEFALKVMKDAAAVREAAEHIYQHCDFILSCMIAGKELSAWSQIPFYRHLARKFPQVLSTVKQRVFGSPGFHKAHSLTGESARSDGRMSTRARPARDIEVISIQSDSSAAGSMAPTVQRGAEGSTLAKTSQLASAVPLRRSRRGLTADELESMSVSDSAGVMTPVRNRGNDDEDEESTDGGSDGARPAARKGKSALRPRPSKGLKSNKQNARSTHDDEVGSEEELQTSSVMAGKRKLDDSLSSLHSRKRKSTRTDVDEDIDESSSPASSDEVSSSKSAMTPPPARADATPTEEAARLNHRLDPIQEDTWVCALDGCMHKVYFASKPDSQQFIKEHYKLHIYDSDERVKLARRLQAPSLPVSHLMERIKLQAAVEEANGTAGMKGHIGPGGIVGSRVAGSRFPDPVLRRL